MGTLDLVIAIHSHQPVGNFDHVFQKAYEDCYKPFLDVVENFSTFKFAYHLSGPLLEWLREHHPDYLKQLARIAKRGQVEILSGGFYEPILASIPTPDAIGQLRMMNDFILEHFEQEASGFWLTERIWTPSLPHKIAGLGLKYTFVDDTHFIYAGLGTEELLGYRYTESEGAKLAIFPGLKELRYAIPFKEVPELFKLLKKWAKEHEHLLVTYADDGEKFGVWPGTHQWVFGKKWLVKFLQLLDENSSWIKTILPREVLEKYPASGRVYMPTASYDEMLKWALPVDAGKEMNRVIEELDEAGLLEKCKKFVRGGVWDNFLTKYPESNAMHKKMIFLSKRARSRPDALKSVWKAQCNCAYWHGLFGGIYLPHLRHAIYEQLIEAQKRLSIGEGPPAVDRLDLDCDGNEEILWHGQKLNVYFAPSLGGRVFEMDYVPGSYNLTNILTRREETYHEEFKKKAKDEKAGGEVKSIHEIRKAKEQDLESWLVYDKYLRGCFVDHFLEPETTLDQYWRADYHEMGDFISSPYLVLENRPSGERVILTLERAGTVRVPKEEREIIVTKSFELKGGELKVRYRVSGDSIPLGILRFGVEQNYTLHTGRDPQRFIMVHTGEQNGMFREMPGRKFEYTDAEQWEMINEWDNWHVICRSTLPFGLWHFPLETVSHSEEGLERVHQGSSLLMWWPLELNSHGIWEATLSLSVKEYQAS